MRNQAIIRIRIIMGVVLLLALILIVRLYQLQVLRSEAYLSMGERQYVHTVQSLYNRGGIYFSTKDGNVVSAATIQSGFLLALNPQRIVDAEAAYAALDPYIEIDHDTFIARATNKDRVYQEIEHELSSSEADEIEAFDLPGVQLYRNQWRQYPGNDLAAQTIGFVGYRGDEYTGLYGLERYYDDILKRNEEELSVNFFAEMFSNLGGVVFNAETPRQGDVVTTIEPTVEHYLQNRLAEVNDEWGSTMTGGIVINPQTGAIYALGTVPTFDLNNRSGVPIDRFRNPLIENVYEMGSIIKTLTMAAGLDSGAVTPYTTYYDAGYLEVDDYTIKNYDGRGRGTVDMQEVLNQSLNTGVSFVVQQMGKDRFRSYFKALKLGSETGIDLPGEVYGLINNLDSPRDVEYATASFGQGIALTPIATVRALSALGNGGILVTPHVAKEIRFMDGTVQPVQYPPGERVFTPETSETISRMLTRVTDEALAGGKVALPNYSVAVKTGTAQIADSTDGGYYADRYLHSFFGYFPAYDPQFLVFLYTVEPKGVRYASETLTTPFMDITEFLINYYSVPPDREAIAI